LTKEESERQKNQSTDHLSALKRAEIIELASYREVKGGTPEKVWKLKITKIVIDLLEVKGGEIECVAEMKRCMDVTTLDA